MLLSNLDLLATAPGGVARLRELILTLAVKGKLVPQDPADEPASMLLQKIRAEKERSITEGKIKRDKPLREIVDEEKPFELPGGWQWARIPEVTYTLGQGEPTTSFSYIDVASIDNLKGVITSEIQVLGAADAPSRARKNVAMGTVIYSTIRPYLKNIAVIECEYSPRAICSTAFAVMHPHDGVSAKYFFHYLRSRPFTAYVNSKAVGVAYPAINDANFFQGVVALPPLAEQLRIVTRVEELMRLCDALEAKGRLEAKQHAQLVSTLLGMLTASTTPEELADNWQRVAQHFDLLLDRPEAIDTLEQTLLQLAVRGLLVAQDPTDEPASTLLARLRTEKDRLIAEGKIKRDKPLPPITDEEKPFELPLGWEWVRLGYLGESFDYGSSQKSVDDSAAVPILRMGNIQGGRVVMNNLKYLKDMKGELPSLVLREGDLLFNRTNSYELVGKTGLFKGYSREVTFASYLIRIRVMNALVHPEYINAYMNTRDCRESEIEPDLTQQTGQANYNGTKLKSIRVPFPPLAEQSRIVARVSALRGLCADLRQRLKAAQVTQSHLAQALVESSNAL